MLLDRPLLPCTPWPSCKFTRPRRWSSCTRVVLTRCDAGTVHSNGPRSKSDKSHSAGPWSDDVHIGGPGAPLMAYLGRYEGDWQASLLGLTDLPGRPIRRSGGGFRPTVLCRSEAFCPDGLLQSPPCHRQHPPAASTSATAAAFTAATIKAVYAPVTCRNSPAISSYGVRSIWGRLIHIPGKLNHAADELSHQPALLGEWRLHPETVQLIGRCFGDAQVDLFASPGHVLLPVVLLPVQGDPWHGCAGIRISPCEPSGTDTVQDQGGRGAGPFGGTVLAQSDLVSRTNAHHYSSFLANSFLREGAPSGTRVQTCGISTCKL